MAMLGLQASFEVNSFLCRRSCCRAPKSKAAAAGSSQQKNVHQYTLHLEPSTNKMPFACCRIVLQVVLLSLLVAATSCSGAYPSDRPALAPSAALSLDGAWTLSCPSLNQTVTAQVPGDIITDLQVNIPSIHSSLCRLLRPTDPHAPPFAARWRRGRAPIRLELQV